MKKKIFGAILCIGLLTMSAIPAFGAELKSIQQDFPIVDEALTSLVENNTWGDNFIFTGGPVLKLYSKVNLISGSENQIKLIERNLNRRLLRFSAILPAILIYASNLTFSVEYKIDIPRNISRFTYWTANASVIYNESGTQNLSNISFIRNDPHKVTVENFTGFFFFTRARLFSLRAPLFTKFFQPAKFAFAGFCDEITFG